MVSDPDIQPRLLDYLPAIYQRSAQIGTFLAAFEAVLFGPDPPGARKSLHGLINDIPDLFDPAEAVPEFLPWLAQWAALTAHEAIPESRSRRLIASMIPLYGIRGTKAYVERTLALYMGVNAVVEEEDLPGLQMGTRSTVGHDTRLGEDPFQFRVELDLLSAPDAQQRLQETLAFASLVVNLAKPAHTRFRLTHNLAEEERGLVISYRSTVGIDTLLWSRRTK
jgi:phage tail-like protein